MESAVVAGPSAAPRRTHSAGQDPLQTDIVQILAKIKGKVHRLYVSLMSQLATALFVLSKLLLSKSR